MTPGVDADEGAHAYDGRVVRRFVALTGGFWHAGNSAYAWIFTIGLVAFLAANVGVQLAVNTWNGWFFNALEERDAAAAKQAVFVFVGLAVAVAGVGVGIVYTRESLQVRWREWVTRRLVGVWFARDGYRRLGETGSEPANPEYRIADDVRMAIEPIVDFAIGLFSATLGAATFLGVLWTVGGSLTVGDVTIPGYMVIAAVVYGVLASALMLKVGRPLVRRIGARNEAEAALRFELTVTRTDARQIVTGTARQDRLDALGVTYDRVVRRWLAVVMQNAKLTWITNGSGALIPVVPLLLAAPKYLSDDLSLGAVVQLAAAFVQVQVAVSWIVDNYRRIAECYASVRRVVELTDALEALEPFPEPRGAVTVAASLVPDTGPALSPALPMAPNTTGP